MTQQKKKEKEIGVPVPVKRVFVGFQRWQRDGFLAALLLRLKGIALDLAGSSAGVEKEQSLTLTPVRAVHALLCAGFAPPHPPTTPPHHARPPRPPTRTPPPRPPPPATTPPPPRHSPPRHGPPTPALRCALAYPPRILSSAASGK